jgi:acyl-CoA synthetase (NDP forming)
MEEKVPSSRHRTLKADLGNGPPISNAISKSLDRVFNPKSVAMIGASASFGKWGQMIFSNLVAGGFPGKIYAVNSREKSIYGIPVYQRVQDIPEPVDLAIITTPADTVLSILESCGQRRIKAAVVVTSGFSETGAEGRALENKLVTVCRERGIVLVGPNTMGILCTGSSVYATGPHTRPRQGSVAFISQSGNLGGQLTHWAEQQGVGVSLFVGSGNEAMVTCSDYLEYVAGDAQSRVIVLYLESMREGRRLFETARQINRTKPVIVLKGGRTEAGRAASASHTGSMSGEITVFRAACRQAGLLEAKVPSELLHLSAGFSSLPLPKGNRVGIVTLGGGWGVVTSDECNEKGLTVPALSESIIKAIDQHLPSFWSKGNPVDLVGTRDPDAPLVAVEELVRSDDIDAVISLGIVGRVEYLRLMNRSVRKIDETVPPGFLDEAERFLLEYEEKYVARTAELMERFEKPVIGVAIAKTSGGVVRPVAGRRYSPVFYENPESAVHVLAKMVEYQNFLGRR